MVSETWDMVSGAWDIVSGRTGHGALGHGVHGTWSLTFVPGRHVPRVGCHVPRISFREGLSRQGKGVSSAQLTAVFNLLLMSYDMPSAQLPCFHPQPQAYLR